MADYRPPVLLARHDQMFFKLTAAEIDRLRKFGAVQTFADGGYLVRAGQQGLGLAVVLSGRVDVSRRDGLGHDQPIVSYGPCDFSGEVGQFSGRAAFVDARAVGPVEALMIPP